MDIGVLSIFQNYRDEHEDAAIMQGELAIALLADELGYDSYWATEHHFFGYSMCPDNLQWLSQIAGATRRIKLGTAAVIMPWNDPYRVAAKVALLDQQSGGRALLGFGRGLSRREYASFGIPMDEARARFDEGTALVLRALDTGVIEADGPIFHQPRATLRPRPTRTFNDRVFSIGVSPESAVQAAVIGARLMVLAQQPWEVFRDTALRPYQDKWRALHGTEPPPPVAGQLVYCDADAARAEAHGAAYVKNYFASVVEHYEITGKHFSGTRGYEFYGNASEMITAIGLDAMAEMYASVNTYGTPAQIVAKIQQQRDVLACDIDVLAIMKYGGMTDAEAAASMRLFAREVMPTVRATGERRPVTAVG
jgi:alkanesulfonate monooxygenase SsuD/methylene tetrahydromethanopterin reductase-like flavin-dependent oxidoreductase (luciferase family)